MVELRFINAEFIMNLLFSTTLLMLKCCSYSKVLPRRATMTLHVVDRVKRIVYHHIYDYASVVSLPGATDPVKLIQPGGAAGGGVGGVGGVVAG